MAIESATPSGSPSLGPSASPDAFWGRLTMLEQPALGDSETSAEMKAVAARGAEVVAVGWLQGEGSMFWFSPDGWSWTQASQLPLLSVSVWDVIAGDSVYVAVGSAADSAAAWTSADGRTWTEAVVAGGRDVELQRIARSGSGFVALGSSYSMSTDTLRTSVWGSADGGRWNMISDPDALAREGQTGGYAIVDGPAGLVIVGTSEFGTWTGGPMDRGPIATAWTSSDGKTWTAVLLSDVTSGYSVAEDLVMLNDTYVAVGSIWDMGASGRARGSAWHSLDGLNWTSAAVGGDNVGAVATGGDGIVALADDGAVSTSVDAEHWAALPALPISAEPLYGELADIVSGGPGTVVVGFAHLEPTPPDMEGQQSAAVWTSPPPPISPGP